jgi:UDP-N-acetylglucosamine--N-acetylmuramyl-(pentapeptide) pyrophosphoryl-undecaprenol N-acetylglucosamine transferase
VVGERDYADFSARSPAPVSGGLVYQQVAFEDRMDLLLTAADVAVQRSGASTVFELAAVGLPSILVPLPGAPGDHQTINARRMVEAGAAVLVPDPELDVDRLALELDRLLAHDEDRQKMSAAARQLAYPAAADAVAAIAEEHARG